MKQNNKIVIDLSKVQWAYTGYQNQYGDRRDSLIYPSSHGVGFFGNELAPRLANYPNETLLQRAARLGVLDLWIPFTKFQLSANHCLIYTGTKAQQMWKAWNTRIFSKQSKKGK